MENGDVLILQLLTFQKEMYFGAVSLKLRELLKIWKWFCDLQYEKICDLQYEFFGGLYQNMLIQSWFKHFNLWHNKLIN